jgi:hypothetical protein
MVNLLKSKKIYLIVFYMNFKLKNQLSINLFLKNQFFFLVIEFFIFKTNEILY